MMDLKVDKYVVYVVVVVLVVVVAFNFEKLTGYAAKEAPTRITITNLNAGDVLNDRTVARLSVENSYPNQRIKVYRDYLDKFTGYTAFTENCDVMGNKASTEYICEADLYLSSNELEDNERYYFQALDRNGRPDGDKIFFVFKA